MATFLLILICVGIVLGTGIYIALMNSMWWKKQQQDSADLHQRQPPQ